jgi:hypothetical protein
VRGGAVMKRLILAILTIALASAASAQNTTVSGTVTDSDSIAWANGTITFSLVGASGTVSCNGTPMTPSQLSVVLSLNGSGAFSGGVCRNSSITPMSSQWGVTVCSAASAPCQNLGNTTISGSTQSLTSFITAAIKPIRIPIAFGTRAYADGEIVNPPLGGVYFNLTSAVNRTWNGSAWANQGGGSSLPTASKGQIISNTDGASAYSGQGQLFYNQSGDTISSIEAACSSLCTYVITSPQTITLSANHTLSSNVQLSFQSGGKWTVNGAFTLTIPGGVVGTLNQHFAGSSTIAFGLLQAYANVEWFGAAGDWNGTTGTNNTTPFQNCINAMQAGQCTLQAESYETTAALSITKSNVGIGGVANTVTSTSQYSNPPASIIALNSATADGIDVGGTSLSANVYGNTFTNFTIARTLVPTSTSDNCIQLQFSYGATVENVTTEDCHNGFHFAGGVGSQGTGVFENDVAQVGFQGFTETDGNNYVGFYVDGTANDNPSLRIRHSFFASNIGSSAPTVGLYALSSINDLMVYGFETAHAKYGEYIQPAGAISADIHFYGTINDTCITTCITVLQATQAGNPEIELNGGYNEGGVNTIEISDSFGVTISNMHFGLTNGPINIEAGSGDITITGNHFFNGGPVINIPGGSGITITGNVIDTGGSGGAIVLASGDSNIAITGNSFSGSNTVGVSIPSGVTNVTGLETNVFGSGYTTPISSAIPFLIPPIGSETITFSATPTFSNITKSSIITMTANITGFTLAAGLDGQLKSLTFCQDATGLRTVTPPSNVRGLTIGVTASKCTTANLVYSANQTAWMTAGLVQNQ